MLVATALRFFWRRQSWSRICRSEARNHRRSLSMLTPPPNIRSCSRSMLRLWRAVWAASVIPARNSFKASSYRTQAARLLTEIKFGGAAGAGFAFEEVSRRRGTSPLSAWPPPWCHRQESYPGTARRLPASVDVPRLAASEHILRRMERRTMPSRRRGRRWKPSSRKRTHTPTQISAGTWLEFTRRTIRRAVTLCTGPAK